MFAEEHQPEQNTQVSTWLVTFADVMALMLAFFVMLFSMSNIQTETWDAIISQISSSETPKKEETPRPQATKNIATVKLTEALSLDYLANVLEYFQ